MGSGNDGPEIDVTNSENGYILQGGLRFTPELGLFKDKGIFKPYIATLIGLGYFNETTVYEDPDNWEWPMGNDDDGWQLDDIEHQQFNFIYSIEFGSNLNFQKCL